MIKKKTLRTLYIQDMKDDIIKRMIKEDLTEEFHKYKVVHKTTCIMDDGGTSKLYIEKLKNLIQRSDVIVFDYGGLYQMAVFGGGMCIVDYWNRFFIKQIEEHPSKNWRCFSALNTFDYDEKENLEKLGVQFKW